MATLISQGRMHARIDSESKIIYSRETNDRYNTIQKVLQLTKQHNKDIRRGLLRLSLMENGLSVSNADKTQPQFQSQFPNLRQDGQNSSSTNYMEDSYDMTI